MIHEWTMEEYQAHKAVSASLLWEIDAQCPAYAYHRSCFNPNAAASENGKHFDVGSALHLAVLEKHRFDDRVVVIDAPNWRTKAAQDKRDQAYAEGVTPLLPADVDLIYRMRRALEESVAAELFFGHLGKPEVSYTWEDDKGIPCKARADRIVWPSSKNVKCLMVDLKSSTSAHPDAFKRSMVRDGHHVRAAWYLDGWAEHTQNPYDKVEDYLFVVVDKTEPHLISVFRLDERALEWGRRLYRRALSEFRRAQETGHWSGYAGEGENKIITASLPSFAEYRLAEEEVEGKI